MFNAGQLFYYKSCLKLILGFYCNSRDGHIFSSIIISRKYILTFYTLCNIFNELNVFMSVKK